MAQDLRGALVGFCNPLLDISAVVGDDLLAEYKLKANDAILASPEHAPLFQTLIDKYDAKLLPGGSAQNTLRGAQLLLPAGTAVFFGAVGDDDNAQRLRKAAEEAGLRTKYMVNPNVPTGTCALLITGHDRSMVADLKAAETYRHAHTIEPENWKDIEAARFYYISGFFTTVAPETIQAVAKHAAAEGKTFTMNLSAPFVPEFFTDKVLDAMPYINVLFGNEAEAAALARALKLETDDIQQIAKHVAALPTHADRPRMVVFTQGAECTVVASSDWDAVREFGVTPVPKDEIGDTNGAGDAFVAGFLSEHILGRPVETCVEAGHWLAGLVVREIGPNYPDRELEFVPAAST